MDGTDRSTIRSRQLTRQAASLNKIRKVEHGTFCESGERFCYSIRLLDRSHLDDALALQDEVLAPLTPPLPLYHRDRDFFDRSIAETGCMFGAFHSDRLFAYATLLWPGPADNNLGVALGLSEQELPTVAQHAGSAVHPAYRRNALQSRLSALREDLARQAGFEHLCGEVIPGNAITIRNHLAIGYFLKAFRVDHLGEPNFVLDKELQRGIPKPRPGEILETALDDIEGFRRMVGRGLWGFGTTDREDGTRIAWGRFV